MTKTFKLGERMKEKGILDYFCQKTMKTTLKTFQSHIKVSLVVAGSHLILLTVI